MKRPKRIIINAGELQMSDGSSLAAYLSEWQRKNGIENGENILLTTRENDSRLVEDVIFYLETSILNTLSQSTTRKSIL